MPFVTTLNVPLQREFVYISVQRMMRSTIIQLNYTSGLNINRTYQNDNTTQINTILFDAVKNESYIQLITNGSSNLIFRTNSKNMLLLALVDLKISSSSNNFINSISLMNQNADRSVSGIIVTLNLMDS